MIQVWDSISQEANQNIAGYADPIMDGTGPGWTTKQVADYPSGHRVIIEEGDRGHIAIWLVTPDD